MFKVKHDRRYKIRYVTRGNRVETADVDASTTTVQNSTMHLMLLALVHQKHNLIIVDVENTYLNVKTSEKVCTKLGKGFGYLSGKIVRIIRLIYVLVSLGKIF